MRVEQLMTKDAACCRGEDVLNEAARIMWERDCGFVPVTASDGSQRVVGVVTDRDLCMAAYFRGASLKEIPVSEVMSTRIRCCGPSDDVEQAEALMREAQVNRLPVVDASEQLLGVISLADIAREAAQEAGGRRKQVSAAEVGDTLAAIRKPRSADQLAGRPAAV